MNDIPRNEAYEIALQEACKGKVVLDVGSVRSRCRLRLQQLIVTTLFCSRGSGRLSHTEHTSAYGQGSGLLAMLAAKAGAEHVYTVEANPDFAKLASEIVDLNHLKKKITVVNTLSTKVEVKKGAPTARCLGLISPPVPAMPTVLSSTR